MKALWLEDGKLFVRDDVPRPAPGQGEALIRVTLAGVCGTDLELVRGYYPYAGVPGHEFVGVVVEAPADPSWIGRRVVGGINAACGECATCLASRATHCEERTVLGIVARDGVHAEFATLPLRNLVAVPDSVSDEAAVFTEPVAAAVEILEQVRIRPEDRVLLVGGGRLGQLVAQVLATTGAQLAVVAKHERQRDLLSARGIRVMDEADVEPRRWDVVVEATGSPSGFQLAARAVRPRGTFVLKSTYRGEITLDLAPFVVDEITIVGSRCGPMDKALELIASGAVDPVPLIEARFPLARAVEAYEAAARPGAMKVLIEP